MISSFSNVPMSYLLLTIVIYRLHMQKFNSSRNGEGESLDDPFGRIVRFVVQWQQGSDRHLVLDQ